MTKYFDVQNNIMDDCQKQLNYFLVKVFNEILKIEEDCLRTGEFKNLSVREMHVIEAVCAAVDQKTGNRSSDIAHTLRISAGTLTATASLLEKKGCIIREKDQHDKRIVRLYPTDKGRQADRTHQQFHQEMVENVIGTLSSSEVDILIKGLQSLESFFSQNK